MRARVNSVGSLPVIVGVASVALAIAVMLVVGKVVDDQEQRLLHDRGGEVAATLQTSITNIESSLPLLARVARLDQTNGKTEFADAAAKLVTAGVVAVGAVQERAGTLRVAAAAGNGAGVGDVLTGPRAALIQRALRTDKLVTTVISDSRGVRIVVAERGRVFVAYEESAVDPTRGIPETPGSPYNDLEIALYASPRADPSKLVITSTGHPLTGGPIDRRVLPVGADQWLLLTSARRPLAGQFATDLPWVILAGGLIFALLVTTLVTVLARRRGYALAAVEARTVELREARAVAEAANQAKSDFLSRMSHELRTPLNAILGFGQVLELDGLGADQQDSVDHIMKGGRHLLGLVDEILDISRIEAGTMTISVEPVEVASALGDVLRMVAPIAAESGIDLGNQMPLADDAYVFADRLRLRQVLLNVLSNAVKYNERGGWVRVSIQPGSGKRLQIRISDSGRGIPADQLDRLFMPFERLGAELGQIEGTGLGLALSRGLMERMGGSISAENTTDGAVFIIELDQADNVVSEVALAAARATGEEQPQLGACRLLYIEDNLSNFQLVERVFAPQRDIQLIPAMQGGLGLELAERHQPDLILLDLHLPDMPGEVLFERLRANPLTRDLPVVVVSADATDSQIQRLLKAGAVDYLTKPLDLRRLLTVVQRYARAADGAGAANKQ
jgi:signal transduction histidine kinase/ActR/RegA family two-component response regulator